MTNRATLFAIEIMVILGMERTFPDEKEAGIRTVYSTDGVWTRAELGNIDFFLRKISIHFVFMV